MKLLQEDKNLEIITVAQFTSPLGNIAAVATHKGLLQVAFSDSEEVISQSKQPLTQNQTNNIHKPNIHLERLKVQLSEYFTGKRKVFELVLTPEGTPFQQKVWNELVTIPFGVTRSYQQQTNRLGDPKAIRAVASANGKNPIAIIIPCHRIIGSNGSLTGYAGGLWRKKWLLEHEAKHSGRNFQSELGL